MRRLLIVDSDVDFANLISEVANDCGYTSVISSSGSASIHELVVFRPDLMFIDLRLNDMDVVELLRQMSQRVELPRLILSSSTDERALKMAASVAEQLGAAVSKTILKPFEIHELESMLEEERRATSQYHINTVALLDSINKGDLEIHFLPVSDLKSPGNMPAGIECAIRWLSPQKRLVPASRFLSRIARSEAESKLVLDALAYGCRVITNWRQYHPNAVLEMPIPLSFLESEENVNMLIALHRDSGLGKTVGLKISEPELGNAVGNIRETLLRLFLTGFRLTLEDFGAGDMSLHNLFAIPFTGLNISGGFIDKISTEREFSKVVASLVAFSEKSDLCLGANNINDADILDALIHSRLDRATGTAVGKAMPIASLEERYKLFSSKSSNPTA